MKYTEASTKLHKLLQPTPPLSAIVKLVVLA